MAHCTISRQVGGHSLRNPVDFPTGRKKTYGSNKIPEYSIAEPPALVEFFNPMRHSVTGDPATAHPQGANSPELAQQLECKNPGEEPCFVMPEAS